MSAAEPLVTCIIPTHNRPDLACRAVQSVFGQTHHNMEVIVVDDSTDSKTREALESLNQPLKYIVNTGKRGASHARNIGISEAKGDFISFLDDDDLWYRDKVECQLSVLRHYPIVTCNYTYAVSGRKYYARRSESIPYRSLLCQNYLGSCSFVMLDHDALKGCFFDESLDCGQDWDMWLTVLKKNSIAAAGNAAEYLVEYNNADHDRITNASSKRKHCYTQVYSKRVAEYDDMTTRMFRLNDSVAPSGSFWRQLHILWLKSRLEKRGWLYIPKVLAARFFGVYIL